MDDVYNTKFGFTVPPAKIPEPEMLLRLERHDETVVNEIIEGLIDWALKITNFWMPEVYEKYGEDLYSEALLTLTQVVHSCLGKSFDTGQFLFYVKRSIVNGIQDWVSKYSVTLSIPSPSRRRNKPDLKQVYLKDYHSWVSDEVLFADFEFDDLISSLFDITEQNLIRMVVNDFTNEEIYSETGMDSNQLNYTKSKIGRVLMGEARD